MSYFPKPYHQSKSIIKFGLNLPNYETKFDLEIATGKSEFAKMFDIASLKSDIDDLNINKLKTFPFDFNKLINVAKNDVTKTTVYNELVRKINPIQNNNSSDLIKKTDYNRKIKDIEIKFLMAIFTLLLSNLIGYWEKSLLKFSKISNK